MKRVTILAAMHGDETYGIDLYRAFVAAYPDMADNVQLIIGNEQAYKDHVRYIDVDMNRNYADKPIGHEATEMARVERELNTFSPDYIFDIHTTKRDSGIFIISDTLNDARKTMCSMFAIPACIMQDEVIKRSFIGNHANAVSLEYSLNAISTESTQTFVDALANLIRGSVGAHQPEMYTVSRLITKSDWLQYPGLKNHDAKPEGVALMVPADESEMDAEYYGFWCHKTAA